MNQQTSKQRVKSLMGRLLSSMEGIFRCDLDDVDTEEDFALKGEDVLLIRNIILDACNDTIRALPGKDDVDFSFPRESFPVYKYMELEIIDDEEEYVPIVTMRGDSKFIYEIRNKIGRGIVYNEDGKCFYNCVGLDNIVDYVIPFLDQARLARIVIANGKYKEWRDTVSKIYRGIGYENN